MPTPMVAHDSAKTGPKVQGFDHIELFVGNVRQSAHYYQRVWGFEPVAEGVAETDKANSNSIVMRHGKITLLLTGATHGTSSINEHLCLHGEGVSNIAFTVDNAQIAYESAVALGAVPVFKPTTISDSDGAIKIAKVKGPEAFTHTLVERGAYGGIFAPGYRQFAGRQVVELLFDELDHVALAVPSGTLDTWAEYYLNIFNFDLSHKEDVATEQTGMKSKVVQDPSGACKFPLVEPAPGKRKSQVQVFLDSNNGPGVQHLAFHTNDIIATVGKLRSRGVEFLRIPGTYYSELEKRVGGLGECLSDLKDLGILVDNDERGLLLQIFARPCNDRGTLFFEIIERRGARGFGGGNIRALFEAIEREQASGIAV